MRRGVGWWVMSGSGKGVQNHTFINTNISSCLSISVTVYPPTLQFVTTVEPG